MNKHRCPPGGCKDRRHTAVIPQRTPEYLAELRELARAAVAVRVAGTEARIRTLLRQGATVREIARRVELNERTVARYKARLRAQGACEENRWTSPRP